MNWLNRMRSSLGKKLNRARKKCPSVKTIKRVGKEVGKDVGETVEIEAEEAVRWARHNPVKVIVGIIASIFILK